ncbi:hypothetical protein Nepgr_031130 [Nepenthes gracilis]|uniref:Peroxidase n=1 Tax=Nepenthes gracilis TaxID=150966 RepID=A0AAD3TGY3_NEPGR|nr:hypothetical protein Nepgr_031130 [Nepenthes gracilis]
MRPSFSVVLATILVAATTAGVCSAGVELSPELNESSYLLSCPSAEQIVKEVTQAAVQRNPAVAPKLLRLHFHDCFVRGCDGSILLNSTPGNKAEKDAPPSLTLGGYEIIDEIKTKLEERCPQVVSCADIVALAARDAVSFLHGSYSLWPVPTGRKDGRISRAEEAVANIPSPFSDFATLRRRFQSKGLDVVDLVALSGAHTIGVSHCESFAKRLYNFTGKGDADPSLDKRYADFLRRKCPPKFNNGVTVEMDPNSSLSFDSHYYQVVEQHMGLFRSDAALLEDSTSAWLVDFMRNDDVFLAKFAHSVVKMGRIAGDGVEIRKHCWVVN